MNYILYHSGIIKMACLVVPVSASEDSQNRANNVKCQDHSETLGFAPSQLFQSSNNINIQGRHNSYQINATSLSSKHLALSTCVSNTQCSLLS